MDLKQTLKEIQYNLQYLIPAVTFVFMSLVPSESLAFVENIELSHEPLRFIRDPDLVNTAIVGIEAFPASRTAGGLLRSATSRIPEAREPLTPGMAVRVLATAYSSTLDQTDGDPFTTASGTRVHPGTMAANFLPFGARVRIGSTIYSVEDRLNARYNGKYIVDVWHPTRESALAFGVRVVEMEIVSLP